MAAVSDYTSDKIRILSLLLTVVIIFHSAFNLQMATGPIPAWIRYLEHSIHYGIRGMAVPFFYICSAYFLCARPRFITAWPHEVAKRVPSLLVPFFLWSGLWVLAMWTLQSIPSIGGHLGRERIASFGQVVDLMTLNPIPHPLWYMRDLFLLTLLTPLIIPLLRSNLGASAYFIGSAALWFSFQSIHQKEAQDLFFFGIGAWLALRRPVIPVIPRPGKIALAVVSLALFAWNCWWVDTRQAENPFIFNPAILLGLPALWLLYDDAAHLLRTPAMLRLSGYALFLYVAHEPLIAILRKASVSVLGNGPGALLTIFVCQTSVVIGALLLIGWILRTYVPWLYSPLVGGRVPRPSRHALRQPIPQTAGDVAQA